MRVNVYAAKSQLSRLLDQAAQGEEVVITRHGRPVAKLVPVGPVREERRLGGLRGKIRIAKDFDAPLPEDLLDEFEGG
jgi:prevent-host-death family protein